MLNRQDNKQVFLPQYIEADLAALKLTQNSRPYSSQIRSI